MLNIFVLLFLVTPCFVVAVQSCMELILILKKLINMPLDGTLWSPILENYRQNNQAKYFFFYIKHLHGKHKNYSHQVYI